MDSLVIYKSSAGSGKTYTLVKEYLRIVLVKPWAYKHVLAVTFTNKATEEMKSRIIDTLSRLAITPAESLTKDRELHQEMQAELQSRKVPYTVQEQAGKVLRLILNDYSNFSVSTIESFFQRIVRAFARELGIPLGYDVEMQQEVVLQRIVDDMYMEVGGGDKTLTKLFVQFLEGRLDEERGWNMDNEIKSLGREIFKEQFQRLAKDSSDNEDRIEQILELAGQLWGIRGAFEQEMNNLADEAFEIMDTYGLVIEDFKYKGSGPANYFRKILQGEYEPGKRAREAVENLAAWSNKGDAVAFRIEQALDAGLPDLMQRAITLYDEAFPRYHTARHVLQTLYSFGVLNDLQRKLSDYRKEHNQLIISDTNFLLHPFVKDNDAPFIYEKVGTRYAYYLLDEFQDTSDMQWLNLRPLLMDALGQGTGGMIVGDAKQSIYRWRNGNMELILSEVKKQIEASGQKVAEEELRDNWRSSADIVNFNNALFLSAAQYLADTFEGEHKDRFYHAYADVSQAAKKTELAGFASIEFYPHRKPQDPPEVPRWQDLALERTGALIHDLMAEGFHGNQIVLLVRRNSEGVKIAEYLQQQHIKVVSNESLLIGSHPRVLFLEAVLRHLNHEGDAISRAALAYYHHLTNGQAAVDHALFDTAARVGLSPGFESAKTRLRQLPVYECVEQLCRLFPLLLEANAYVQGFLDAVLEYSSSQDASISGFLSWWKEVKNKRAIAAATEVDAVQIMTIHKSKGLEFPVVIVPFADWEITPGTRDVLWLSTEKKTHPFDRLPYLPVKSGSTLEKTLFSKAYGEEKLMAALDNLNLLYVAFTRAQTRLYAFSQDYSDAKSVSGTRLAHLLHEVIPPEELPGRMLENPRRFESGTAQAPVPEKEASQQADTLDMPDQLTGQSDWGRRMRVRFTFERYPFGDIMERREKVDVGQLLHEALSFVRVRADISKAVDRMFFKGYFPESQKSTLQHQLEAVLGRAEAADWYSGAWEVRNEADILGPLGELLRPDRVMLRDREAVVVDYKTGKERAEHSAQVATYMKALEKIGYLQVTGFVYYIGSGKILAVE